MQSTHFETEKIKNSIIKFHASRHNLYGLADGAPKLKRTTGRGVLKLDPHLKQASRLIGNDEP